MIRATTGGVMRTYRSNLMGSFINMNASRNTVLSQRNFNSYAEDPAAAARAFRLRKSRMTVKSQYDICVDTKKKYESAVACLQSNDNVLCTKDGVYGEYMNTLTGTTLKMLNDPSGDARTQLSKALDQMSQSIIQTMNQKYGDNFIFAGADGHNVPFEIRDDGKLYYRGVPVDAAMPDVLTETGADGKQTPIIVSADGKIDPTANPAYYLRMESYNVKTISKKEYEDLYTEPNRQTFDALNGWAAEDDGTGNPVMYAYDSVGKPIKVIKEADGSYSFYDDGEARHPNDGFITLDENNVYYKLQNGDDELMISVGDAEKLKTSPPSSTDPIEYDADGRIRIGGGYYKREYETDGSSKLISQQEYDETLKRANGDLPFRLTDANGNVVPVNEDGSPDAAGGFYRIIDDSQLIDPATYEAQKLDAEKLDYLAKEKYFVDIGLGFQEDDTGKLIESSGYNAALNGIIFLGYGLDEDGDPKNLYSLVQKMQKIASGVDSGTDWSDETYDEFYRLVQKFEDGVSNYQTEFVNLDASTTKLKNQEELLSDNFYNLQEQYSDLEDVDMVDAITSFIWAEYCYNAALKVGNSILGQSLMDYLS